MYTLFTPWDHEFAWYGERRTGLNSFREVQLLGHCSYLKEEMRGREGRREKEREREREKYTCMR